MSFDTRRSVIVDPAPENLEGVSDLPDQDTARRLEQAQRNPASQGQNPQRDEPSGSERPDWIPEKFWDGDVERSAKKLAESYNNLESDRGRLANEVGTLRHLVDEALDLKRTRDLEDNGGSAEDEDSRPVTADDLLNDPEGTLTRVVQRANRPLEQRLAKTDQERALADFEDRHPTFREDMQDQQFLEFVGQSAYRRRLAQKVFESERKGQPDFDAAEELWSGWEEVRQSADQDDPETHEQASNNGQPQRQTQQRRPAGDDVSQAAVVTRGGAETDVSHKPVYSRAALVNKRTNDPDGYYDPSFQAEVMQAYAEGRVK